MKAKTPPAGMSTVFKRIDRAVKRAEIASKSKSTATRKAAAKARWYRRLASSK